MRLHSMSNRKLCRNVYLEKMLSVVQWIMMAERNNSGQHNLDLIAIKFCTALAILYRT